MTKKNKRYASQRLGIHCPYCQSSRLVKDGKVVVGRKDVQRWLCKNCGVRTHLPKKKK